MNKTFESILFGLLMVACWFIGWTIGDKILHNEEKKAANEAAKEVIQTLDRYAQTSANFMEGFAEGETNAQEYILTTYTLYEEIYRYTLDAHLLKEYPEQFNRACKILDGIYQNQMEIIQTSNNVLAIAGLTTIPVLEMEKYSHLMEALTVVTCEETLKIDPGNQQAMDMLNKLSEQKRNAK